MAREETTKENRFSLSKDQHFHMKFIIKKFRVNDKVPVWFKDPPSEQVVPVGLYNKCFLADRVWSQEFESNISHPIENAFKTQVERVLAGQEITNHRALFDYKILWRIRHHYAHIEIKDKNLYNSDHFGSFSKEDEEYIESIRKVPMRAGGVMPARFVATHELKAHLEANRKNYDGGKWIALYSPEANFISADDYQNRNCIPISPRYLLMMPQDQSIKSHSIDKADTVIYNNESKELASRFWFGEENT